MQILIKGLRSTKTGSITQAEVNILRRIKTQIGTRTENDMIHQIMLIQTTSKKNPPLIILPFVLEKATVNIHRLFRLAVVSPHIVFQTVTVVFQSGSEIGRHKEATPETVHILCTPHGRKICGFAVGIQVLPTAIITVTVCIQSRSEKTQAMFFIGREVIELQATAINSMFQLFGYIGFVRRTIQQISSPAELLQMMILKSQLRVSARLEIRTETYCLVL